MILPFKAAWPAFSLLALAACTEPLDFDLRGQLGAFSTAPAAQGAIAERPQPDDRGVISYPTYQVAVARRGDTLETVAARIGLPATELAGFNGVATDASLRDGEIIALPRRVAEPVGGFAGSGATGQSNVDVTTLAGQAIENAPDTSVDTAGLETTPLQPAGTGPAEPVSEPIRHRVERGETAYTVARLYSVPVRSLAEWNGLGPDFAIREGQYLLIPVTNVAQVATPEEDVTAPGQGTETPTPPSASDPLPVDDTDVAIEVPPAPDIGEATRVTDAAMASPVEGAIIREYAKGRNEGIDIKGEPGGPVAAAADGTVAAITKSAEGVPIIVLRHPENVLTVYANVDEVAVEKGDQVTRGSQIAALRSGDQSFVHFEVRQGFDSVDPMAYLQ